MTVLVAEPMGRLSNVLLLDASGKILDCIHRAPGGENAQRLLLPGKPYSPPPPRGSAASTTEALITTSVWPLWSRAKGFFVEGADRTGKPASALRRREAAWLASGDANAPAHAASVVSVAQALQTLWLPVTTGQWQPGVIEETGVVVGFSVYPVHFRGEFILAPRRARLSRGTSPRARLCRRRTPTPLRAARSPHNCARRNNG